MPPSLRGVLLAALLSSAPTALAAPCAGFADVDSAQSECPSVEWLKNRQVTLGCNPPGTLYCPLQPVIRLSMAAFLNRLGVALSPAVLYHEATGPTLDLDNPPATLCATTATTISGYHRQAHAAAAFTASAGAALANVDLRLLLSTDGGATWTPLTTSPARFGGVSKWINAGTWKTGIPLSTGTTYRFGVQAARSTAIASTGDLVTWTCQLKVVLHNRTGSSSPF